MTKDSWIYLVQNWLGGGSAPNDIKAKYRKGIVSEYIGMAFNEKMTQIYLATHDLDSLNSYCKVYPSLTIITTDTVLNKKYIDIPCTNTNKILQIPDNKAIRTVYLDTNPKTRCIYRKMDAEQVYADQIVNTYLAEPRWDLLGERIYFSSHKDVAPYATVTTATVKMIVPWSEFASDEDIPMPFESNEDIFNTVVNKLRIMPPEDKIIDQNVVQPILKAK